MVRPRVRWWCVKSVWVDRQCMSLNRCLPVCSPVYYNAPRQVHAVLRYARAPRPLLHVRRCAATFYGHGYSAHASVPMPHDGVVNGGWWWY